jgi:Na+/melibiose symporter-like transporter
VSAILSQFSQPSVMKLFKQHIAPEQMQQAMAVFQSLVAIFMVLGPSLGVFVYRQLGIEIAIAIMGVAFLLSAVVLFRLPSDVPVERSAAEKPNFARELKEGFAYVWRSPVLKVLGGAFAAAGLAVGIAQTLGLFIVTERLGQHKDFLQFLLAVNGVAMLIGGGLVMAVAKRVPPQKLLALGMSVGALCTIGVGWSTSVSVTLALQFINGLVFPCIQIGINTMILQWTNQSFIGRVNGVLNPMFMGMMVIMMSVSGLLKKVFPLVGIYTASGLLMLLGTLLLSATFKYKPEQGQPSVQPAASGGAGH